MTTEIQFARDISGFNTFAPLPSDNVLTATLVNGVASSFALPGSAQSWIVSFSFQPGSCVWVDFTGATASIPAGGTLASATSELNPGSRNLFAFRPNGEATTISVITSNVTADISISLYSRQIGA